MGRREHIPRAPLAAVRVRRWRVRCGPSTPGGSAGSRPRVGDCTTGASGPRSCRVGRACARGVPDALARHAARRLAGPARQPEVGAVPGQRPGAASALMARFYRMLAANERSKLDPVKQPRLEVQWWRAHRENQYGAAVQGGAGRGAARPLRLLLRGGPRRVREAAQLRADAMDISDRWIGRAATPRARCWPRSARCSCAPTPRYWPPSIASTTASSSATTSRSSLSTARWS